MSKEKSIINSKFWQPQLQLVAKLASWVAFPVIIGAWLGQWLDKKYDTEPWLFLITVGFSFLISMFGLIINTVKEYKKITESNNINQNNSNHNDSEQNNSDNNTNNQISLDNK